ncbi:ATPase, partial [Vibrionales bacterium C3R12]
EPEPEPENETGISSDDDHQSEVSRFEDIAAQDIDDIFTSESSDAEEDWLSAAIDDVESTQDETESDFDFAPTIEGVSDSIDSEDEGVESESSIDLEDDQLSAPPSTTDESLADKPEEMKQPNMPESIPNEFGMPQDDDWLTDDDELVTEAEPESAPVVSEPEIVAFEPEDPAPEAPVQPSVQEFDELELPEYGEEDALADAFSEPSSDADIAQEPLIDEQLVDEATSNEPVTEGSEPEAPAQSSVQEFDELELPEYGEEDALADAFAEPNSDADIAQEPLLDEPLIDEQLVDEPISNESVAEDSEPEAPVQPSVQEFDELELPEYGEEDALADAFAEPSSDADIAQEPLLDEQLVDEPISNEPAAEVSEPEAPAQPSEQEFDELELPEYGEEDALADAFAEPSSDANIAQEPLLDESLADEQLVDEATINEPVTEGFESEVPAQPSVQEFDELELPEYGEEDALADAFSEPSSDADIAQEPEPATLAQELDELELPEYSEQDALADAFSSVGADTGFDLDSDSDLDLGSEEGEAEAVQNTASFEDNSDKDALQDLFSASADEILEEDIVGDFDESALAELLSEDVQHSVDDMFRQPMDSRASDSAGLDIEAMLDVGGEDWDGFNLSPDQNASNLTGVPEDQREVWQDDAQLEQPKIQAEDWGNQNEFSDFDAKKSEFMTIDQLMAEVDQNEPQPNPDEEELKLDVGLNEFPDVIGDNGDVDVDSHGEAAGKLDLAKIYIEMNDSNGAIKLLEEAIVYGDDTIRREAKNLIDTLNRQ